jgi:hypothetical protein
VKKTKLVLHEPSINRIVGGELHLRLDDEGDLMNAISEVDKLIGAHGGFPISEFQSLLHMIYNPEENRFYKQVSVLVYDEQGRILSLRESPKTALPNGATIVLIPAGGCISEWEEALDYKRFSRALQAV